MKRFVFKHGPGLVDGLRVIANIGDKGSVQKITAPLLPGQAYRWLGAASIMVSGAIALTRASGVRVTLKRGDVLPSIMRQSEDTLEEAIEDNTVLYCFQGKGQVPMWSRGFILDPATALKLPARSTPSRCILVDGWARCNDVMDLNVSLAPHILKVSPNKPLSIVGDGVLLYVFEREPGKTGDPAGDDDPLVDDYMKGLVPAPSDAAGLLP